MEVDNRWTKNQKQWASLTEAQRLEISANILKKPFSERTEDDLALLIQYTENTSFFQELGKEIHQECCNYLTFSYADKDQVIIKEGDYGTTFYIILKGSVGVYRYAPKADAVVEENASPTITIPKEKTEARSPRANPRSVSKLDDFSAKSNSPPTPILMSPGKSKIRSKLPVLAKSLVFINMASHKKEEKILIEQTVLTAGSSFGERALLSNARRKATIIAKEPSYFACLEKQYFDLTLKDRESKLHTENVNFLTNLNYFKLFSYHKVEQIYYVAKKQKFNKNQIVYSEGDSSDSVYIIREGQFRLLKLIEIKPELDKLYLKHDLMNNSASKRKSPRKNGEIAIFSAREIFGEYEVIQNIPRTCSVVCDSPSGELYVLSKQIFLTKLYTDINFKLFIDNQRQIKSNIHQQRLDLIESFTNKNKNLLLHVGAPLKVRTSQTHSLISKSASMDKIQGIESNTLKFSEQDCEFLKNAFKERGTNITRKFKDTLSVMTKKSGYDQKDEHKVEQRVYLSSSARLNSKKKRSIFTQNQKQKRSGSTLLDNNFLKIGNESQRLFGSPIPTPSPKHKSTRSQIIIQQDCKNYDVSEVFPQGKVLNSVLNSENRALMFEKNYLITSFRSSLRSTPRSPTVLDIKSFNEGTHDLTNNILAKRESPVPKIHNLTIETNINIQNMNGDRHQPLEINTLKKTSEGFFQENFVPFIGSPTLSLHSTFQSLPASPALSHRKRTNSLIGPIKKMNFKKEVTKIQEYMHLKLNGNL